MLTTRTAAIAASVVLGAGLAALAVYPQLVGGGGYAQCDGGATSAELGGPFELVSETGQTVTDADVITGPTLFYFGYTFCPDVCPLDVVRNVEATDILRETGLDVTPVFVTVDPERDTPQEMADFTANISPDLLGLTGSTEQVAAAVRAYKIYAKIHEAEDEFYLVDHSTLTYLAKPGEGVVGFFRRELSGEQLADKLSCFVEGV